MENHSITTRIQVFQVEGMKIIFLLFDLHQVLSPMYNLHVEGAVKKVN